MLTNFLLSDNNTMDISRCIILASFFPPMMTNSANPCFVRILIHFSSTLPAHYIPASILNPPLPSPLPLIISSVDGCNSLPGTLSIWLFQYQPNSESNYSLARVFTVTARKQVHCSTHLPRHWSYCLLVMISLP